MRLSVNETKYLEKKKVNVCRSIVSESINRKTREPRLPEWYRIPDPYSVTVYMLPLIETSVSCNIS